MYNNIESLLYVNVPKELAEKNFPQIDYTIPLPIQLPDFYEHKEFRPEDLQAEMILAGLLTVFAYDRENINIKYYRKIFKLLRPEIRKELTEAAIIKSKNGDFDTAEELLLSLEGLFPEDNITKLNLALLMEERFSNCTTAANYDMASVYTDKAESLYNYLISSEPPIPNAFFNAAYFFAQRGNFSKAKSLLQTYLQIETDTSETAETRKEKAKLLLKSIQSESLDDKLFSSAYSAMQTGDNNTCIENIKEFLRRNQKSWNGWFLLGWALRRQERWENGKAALLTALELLRQTEYENEPFCEILNELSICCMELELFAESEEHLLKALNLQPENIKIISNLGTLALKQGKKEEAESFFKIVLTLNPNDEIAKMVLSNSKG